MAIPHNLLIKVLSEIKNFVFKLKTRSCISFTKASVRWTLISCGGKYFTRETLIDAILFLITKSFFTIQNLVFKQGIGTPMGMDPAPYWETSCYNFLIPNIFSN